MIDAREVSVFATKLAASPGIEEEAWRAEWSEKTADIMRSTAPVDTRELVESIQVDGDGVIVGAEHGPYVEYGTADTPPQPFAGPAVDSVAKPAADDAGRRVVRGLVV